MAMSSVSLKVEAEDVLGLLISLDVNKATGSDGISAKLLRTCASGISPNLTSLFNCSLLPDMRYIRVIK